MPTATMSETGDQAFQGLSALEAAEQRAYERGRANARLTAQVQSHEKRLDAINGNIIQHVAAQEITNDRLDKLTASVEKSTAIAKARADVAAELAEKVARTNVDKRTLILTVVLAAAAVAGVLVAALQFMVGH